MKIFQEYKNGTLVEVKGPFSVIRSSRYYLVAVIDGEKIELGQCNDYEKTYKKGIDQWISKVYSRCVDTEASYRWQAANLVKMADGEKEITDLIKSMKDL